MDVNGKMVRKGQRVCVVSGDYAGTIGRVTYSKNGLLTVESDDATLFCPAEIVAVV